MIFYYAAGGGLGHLTRARAVVYTLGLPEPVKILTSSPFADDRRVLGGLEAIKIPPAFDTNRRDYRRWLQALFATARPTALFLDAFPAGLLGEFCDFEFPAGLKLHHLARLLRWDEYEDQLRGVPPVFDVTYVLEPLDRKNSSHHDFLRQQSTALEALALEDPPHELTDEVKELAVRVMRPSVAEYTLANRRQAIHRPIWLVVHAGPGAEIAELLAYAEELARIERSAPRLIVLSPEDPEPPGSAAPAALPSSCSTGRLAFEHYDFYPASAFYPLADRIITACGFNTMRQTLAFHEKHRFLPFARRFDDQFQRAALRRRITAPGNNN